MEERVTPPQEAEVTAAGVVEKARTTLPEDADARGRSPRKRSLSGSNDEESCCGEKERGEKEENDGDGRSNDLAGNDDDDEEDSIFLTSEDHQMDVSDHNRCCASSAPETALSSPCSVSSSSRSNNNNNNNSNNNNNKEDSDKANSNNNSNDSNNSKGDIDIDESNGNKNTTTTTTTITSSSNNNNNNDATKSVSVDPLRLIRQHRGGKGRQLDKILHSSSSSSSASSFQKSSSLSSVSEEEMLSMMDKMGESDILSVMPPCDCDDCLLNDPGSPTTVPPDKRKLTRTSSWRKIRSFILWSPFIQVFKKHRYPWIQLAGHQGNFHAGEAGSVLKKLDPREQACFQRLMADPLKDFVPEYSGDVERNGEMFIQLQDLLASFSQPCVMDVKMGVRTYLEAELEKARRSPTLRKDMYQKMVEVDSNAPTEAEHDQRAVTKPRYMQWRDQMSSSTELGFRVEGIKKTDGSSTKDFKKTKTRQNIVDIVTSFVANNETIAAKYIKRLKDIMAVQESSDFFRSHEVVGSSLLFVHDAEENVGVWMIDFGKTDLLPSGKTVDHRSRWEEGNREDGYLYGLDNLVSIFEEVHGVMSSSCV